MKISTSYLSSICILFVSLFLFSCQRELQEPAAEPTDVSVASTHGCKAEVLGVVVDKPDGTRYWRTLMQKWYGTNGKPAYLKAHLGTDLKTYENFAVMLDWGEVTYPAPNQVFLRDVLRDQLLMRVTIDGAGRPLASYFKSEAPAQPTFIDTSYYYYVGGKLDEIISISRVIPTVPATYRKFKLMYDMHGNLTRVQTGDTAGSFRMNFKYDYTKPVTDMMPGHFVNLPHALIEYLDLWHFPIHHQMTQVVLGPYVPGSSFPDQTNPLETWDYTNYMQDGNGLVYSYMDVSDPSKKTFYTGWNCSLPTGRVNETGTRIQRNEVKNLMEFQKRFPKPVQ